MISFLSGIIKLKQDNFILVDVHDVGYKVFVCKKMNRGIGKVGQKIRLFTYQHVRENEISLYGFADFNELALFEVLISVSGIGPKAGLNILELGPVSEIKRAIADENMSYLTRVSGLGKKKSQRLIIESKSKIEDLGFFSKDDSIDTRDNSSIDALQVLIGLGYKENEARDALREVPEKSKTTEEKVRGALKNLGQSV